jgi:hypothetical protein
MPLRFVFVGLLVVALVAGASSSIQARTHGLTGSARFQIGDGLPLPIGFTAVPNGKIAAIPGATVMQHGVHAAGNPAKLVIDPFQWAFDGAPVNLVVFQAAFPTFQVHTNLTYMIPRDKVMLSAGRRTGAATVTFCGNTGSTVTAMGNPGCLGGTTGTGRLRYTRTANQFGGPAQASIGGSANVAMRGAAPAPCAGVACIIAFFVATGPPTGAVGAPFGFTNVSLPPAPNPGAFTGTVSAMGKIVNLGMALGPGLVDTSMSWGGPWTTGMVSASAPAAVPPELFQLTGMDLRATGTGMGVLSLVAGGFSQRSIGGPNANRGWLNLTISAPTSHVPSLPGIGVVVLGALMGGWGARSVRRRRA